VGLGNLWRFPTLAGENGGGVFLFAYAVAVIFVAILGWKFSADYLSRQFGLRGKLATAITLIVRAVPIVILLIFGATAIG
jgi:uncharacterized membrane protein YidH (DUF202 family)